MVANPINSYVFRFTTVSLLTEHEPAPDPVRTIMASLGPGPLRRRRESAPSFPAPSLSRRVSTRDTDCWSWGPPPLSTDRSSWSAGPSERIRTRWRDRSCWSPPAISTLISEKKLSRVEVLPLLLWVSAVSYSLFCLSGTCRYC